jgi:hypothetical protein
MKFVAIEQIRKLRESGPTKKQREFWGISRKDLNSSNYNIWLCWMNTVIEYLEKRSMRNIASQDTTVSDEHPHSEIHS